MLGGISKGLFVGVRAVIGGIVLADLLYPQDRWQEFLKWIMSNWAQFMNAIFDALPIIIAPDYRNIWAFAIVMMAAVGVAPFLQGKKSDAWNNVFAFSGIVFIGMIVFSFLRWAVTSLLSLGMDATSASFLLDIIAAVAMLIGAIAISPYGTAMIAGAAIAIIALNEVLLRFPAASLPS